VAAFGVVEHLHPAGAAPVFDGFGAQAFRPAADKTEGRHRAISYALLEDGAQYEDYPDFTQPALIFHGVDDDVVPAGLSRRFVAAHPNATLEIVDSGHQMLNVLDSIAPQVTGFLLS
jgi:pimeloyl-ACP methyl ester carboxylesterase